MAHALTAARAGCRGAGDRAARAAPASGGCRRGSAPQAEAKRPVGNRVEGHAELVRELAGDRPVGSAFHTGHARVELGCLVQEHDAPAQAKLPRDQAPQRAAIALGVARLRKDHLRPGDQELAAPRVAETAVSSEPWQNPPVRRSDGKRRVVEDRGEHDPVDRKPVAEVLEETIDVVDVRSPAGRR